MKTVLFLLYITLCLLNSIPNGSAIRCYQCSLVLDLDCYAWKSPKELRYLDCPSSRYCGKTTMGDSSQRLCRTSRFGEGCTRVNDIETCTRYCETDLCNGQSVPRPSLFLALICAIGVTLAATLRR